MRKTISMVNSEELLTRQIFRYVKFFIFLFIMRTFEEEFSYI
jgi:hypothetical protein